jgi:hypothetical protein
VCVSIIFCNTISRSQTAEGGRLSIKVVSIERSDQKCTVEASSDKVSYKLSSEVSSCRALLAGNMYKALRATIQNDPGDRTKDSPILVIFKNADEKGDNFIFGIVSEKVVKVRPCPSNDPLGIRTNDNCQPLPQQEHK